MAFWDKITTRGNVEDRRGSPGIVGGGLSLTGIALIFLLNYLNGGSLGDALGQLANTRTPTTQSAYDAQDFQGEDSYEVFASKVLGSANQMWSQAFKESRISYDEPRLVLFRNATESSCGGADARVGPHYCPSDETIYLDETFFDELTKRFGAEGGDVAEAYVIAHEIGHHVQNELGILNEGSSNEDSVRTELQADCLAGLWAYSVKSLGVFEPGEIREAVDAAAAVGDDRIQAKATGRVNPETWTHGSSEDRVAAFNKGYETGDAAQCGL
jgi:uncharacterized protein